MDKQLKTELRKLLTGRTIRDEEGWLIAVPEGSYFIYHGITDRTGYRKIKCVEDSKVFNSAKAASEYYGVDHKTIINSCNSLKAIRKNNKHFIFYSEGENNE